MTTRRTALLQLAAVALACRWQFAFGQSSSRLTLSQMEEMFRGLRAKTAWDVERVEKHTPASLHARNQQFYALADKFAVDVYDGMDVGPAAG